MHKSKRHPHPLSADVQRDCTTLQGTSFRPSVFEKRQDPVGSNPESFESRTFFLKMVGDYKRYLIEVYHGDDRKEVIEEAR